MNAGEEDLDVEFDVGEDGIQRSVRQWIRDRLGVHQEQPRRDLRVPRDPRPLPLRRPDALRRMGDVYRGQRNGQYVEFEGRTATTLERGIGTDPWDAGKELATDGRW